MCEQLGISALTEKSVKGDNDSAIEEHLLFCSHAPDFEAGIYPSSFSKVSF